MSIKSIAILLAMLLLGIPDTMGQGMGHDIEGVTWLDMDDDGTRTALDNILPLVKVDLFDEQGAMVQFTFSDDNGNYSFTNIPEGIYYLKFERKQGLKLALKDVGDDNIDSDLASNGISSLFFLDSNNPLVKLDAGFRSSILILTKAFLHVCEGTPTEISPTITGNSGTPSFHWSHDGSTESSTSFMADSNLLIRVTVTDDWNIPVVKNIFIKLTKGVSIKDCEDVDVFDFTEVPIDIFVSEDSPGPISVIDINENFIGGGRNISIELLEGANISSINSSSGGVFINNCSGCRTSTTLTYFSPDDEYLDISQYSYFELTEMKIDQGNVAVTITVTDDFRTSTLSDKIESEGPNTDILPVFFFEDFDQFDQMDFSKLRTISLNFTSINESIDILMSSILSCKDQQCFTTLPDAQDICISESATLSPESTCADGLIYLWDDLGFGKDQTVSPIDTTTYALTVYDQNGCSENLSSSVNVNQPPTVEVVGPQDACFGETVAVSANITEGSPPYSYQWSNTAVDTSAIEILATQDTTISAVVTDANGCMESAQIAITVHQNPSVSLNVGNTLCSQPTGSISATITGGTPPYSLEWSNDVTNQDSITDLDFGLYTLEVTDSLGCSTSASALVNFLPCAELGNYVWHDINYDGIQDSTDLPLQGVIVLLRNEMDEEIGRDTTDEDGLYLFDALEGGEYIVEFEPPKEYYATHPLASLDTEVDSDADTLSHKTVQIVLAEYEKNYTIDAGWYQKVCIGDQVWNDINLNHYFDSLDVGIENVVVKIMDCGQNLLDSTTTDLFGNYSFCDLDPGEYSLQFCSPDGLVAVEQNVGDETIDSDINAENSITDCKQLLSGDTLVICDAGFYNISSIGDYVWHDLNANGVQEDGEPPIGDVPVSLYSCDGQFLSSIETDSTGYYIFDSLSAGDYYLEVTPLPNSILSPESMGQDSLLDSDFDLLNNRTSCIDLLSGQDRTDIDAGLYFESSIGDFVWIDYDLDGLQDTLEEVVENLKLYLLSCDGNLLDSTYSNAQGYYHFQGLMPGMYKVKIELNNGQAVTDINNIDHTINNDIHSSTLESDCIYLASSQEYEDMDVGLYNLGKIGDLVWYDENGNGIQDQFEKGVPNVIITLFDCNENVVSVTESGEYGEYCFPDIPYGDYIVHYNIPEPYFLVNAGEGGDDALDSNPDPNSNNTECVTISTPVDSTIDAGITTCSTIGGIAWFDAYILNSIKDPLENGVNGIKVRAYKNINGSWNLVNTSYTGLKPGNYSEDGYWEMCVSPGEYYFEFSDISVIEAVEPNQGNDDYLDSDAVHIFGTNTTDIITVHPGIHTFDTGIGYWWKNNSNSTSQGINVSQSRIFVDENESTIYMEPKSTEMDSSLGQREMILKESTSTSEDKIRIFPNPSTGFINVHIPSPSSEPFEFIIYENSGRVINSKNLKPDTRSNIYSIDLTDLKSGLHHLLIKNKNMREWLPFIKI